MEEFIRDHGETCLELFECPAGVDPLYFNTLCVYFYAERQKVINQAKEKVKRDVSVNSTGVGDGQQGSRPSENTNESTQPNQSNKPKPNTTGYSKKKPKSKSQYLGGYAGKVMVGSHHQPICIPAGSCKFLVGTAKGVPHKGNFMMEELRTEIFHQASQLTTLTSNLLNQDESQYAYKTPMTTMCGSGNLSMLVIYGTWTRKIGNMNQYLSKTPKPTTSR